LPGRRRVAQSLPRERRSGSCAPGAGAGLSAQIEKEVPPEWTLASLLKAVPNGTRVTATAKLVESNGRFLGFEVEARALFSRRGCPPQPLIAQFSFLDN